MYQYRLEATTGIEKGDAAVVICNKYTALWDRFKSCHSDIFWLPEHERRI